MKPELELTTLVRRVKRKRWILTVLVALGVSLVMLVGGYQLVQQLTRRDSNHRSDYLWTIAEIKAPNILANDHYLVNPTAFGGQVLSHRYKRIAGQSIAWSPAVANYALRGSTSPVVDQTTRGPRGGLYDVETQQKIPEFFNQHLTTKEKRTQAIVETQELAQVVRTRRMVGEVALTFKRPMTYREIRQQLPAGLTAAWFWIGLPQGAVTLDNDFLGVQSRDAADEVTGRLTARQYREFRQKLTTAAHRYPRELTINDFSLFRYGGQYAQRYRSLATAEFAGVIVTGTSAAFKKLGTPRWVAASSAGVVVPQAPVTPTLPK
ncbi:sigma factor regulator N-terminal domain-containing protein [Levilactobacillus zymae]|uniref:sigma factor regulator N-terminal domain-containing protein n=1 Tax=Levilactobacillus zymae TaxID=267363 RepID=UPI0028BC8BA7|nr:sigma factor regulator N-terminal domain-containing protein [Levilactobacillus zymae]MDT6979948.1 anti sigma factor C-terminal domain-containing protein [Levilactobacillus zymae]